MRQLYAARRGFYASSPGALGQWPHLVNSTRSAIERFAPVAAAELAALAEAESTAIPRNPATMF